MFVLNQDKNCLVNIDKSNTIKVGYSVDTRKHRIAAQVGYLIKPDGMFSPISEILGEYEDESDADEVFKKLTYLLKRKTNYFEMPFDECI